MRTSLKKWYFIYIVGIPAVIMVAQFFAFKNYDVYSLSRYSYKFNHACWVDSKPEYIVLGSSTARYSVIPKLIADMNGIDPERVVNLAMNAATPWQNYNTYDINIDTLREAKVVYYNLDPWILTERYYKHSTYERILWNHAQWKQFAEEERAANNYFMPASLFLRNFSRRKCRVEFDDRGYSRLQTRDLRPLDEWEYGKWYRAGDVFGISEFELKYIRELKSIVEKNGSEFVILLIPKHQRWLTAYSKETEFDGQLVDRLNDLLWKVRVVCSYDAARYNLTDQDFFDNYHLSHSGAEKYTQIEFTNIQRHLDIPMLPFRNLYSY